MVFRSTNNCFLATKNQIIRHKQDLSILISVMGTSWSYLCLQQFDQFQIRKCNEQKLFGKIREITSSELILGGIKLYSTTVQRRGAPFLGSDQHQAQTNVAVRERSQTTFTRRDGWVVQNIYFSSTLLACFVCFTSKLLQYSI